MNKILYSSSAWETKKIGKDFAKGINPGVVLCLYGNLGAGKTTFVQGFARGLGIKRRIISPTFTVVRSYTIFYHVDLYRLSGEQDIEGTGLLEIFKDKNSIIAIEWPEKLGSLLPKKRSEIWFKDMGEDRREISILNIKD